MVKKQKNIFIFTIDLLIILYVTSVFVFSYNESLYVYSNMIAFALMGMLAIYIISNGSIKINGVILCFAGFVFWGILSYFWALDKSTLIVRVFTLIKLLILFLLLYIYLSKENKVEMLILALGFGGCVFAAYVLATNGLSAYVSGLEEGMRMGVDDINVNTIGLATASGALISFWYAFYKKKYYFLFFAALATFVAFGTGSRKVLILLVVGVVMMFILKNNTKKRVISLLEGVAILLILYALLQLPIFATINDRFDSMLNAFTGNGETDDSTRIRLKMISIGWDQFIKTPLAGIGLDNSGVITQKFLGTSSYLHNNYIELLACVGIIGFVLYYAMYLIPLSKLIAPSLKGDSMAVIALILLVAQLFIQFGVVQYYSKSAYLQILAFTLVAERFGKKNEQNIESVQIS